MKVNAYYCHCQSIRQVVDSVTCTTRESTHIQNAQGSAIHSALFARSKNSVCSSFFFAYSTVILREFRTLVIFPTGKNRLRMFFRETNRFLFLGTKACMFITTQRTHPFKAARCNLRTVTVAVYIARNSSAFYK
jgi:hypothetical protein